MLCVFASVYMYLYYMYYHVSVRIITIYLSSYTVYIQRVYTMCTPDSLPDNIRAVLRPAVSYL